MNTDEKLKYIEKRFKEIGPIFHFSYGNRCFVFYVKNEPAIKDITKRGVLMFFADGLNLDQAFDIAIDQLDNQGVFEDIKKYYEEGITQEQVLNGEF